MLSKEETWKRMFNANSELWQNRTEKQIMPLKTTVKWLFNNICYLVIGCFDWNLHEILDLRNCNRFLSHLQAVKWVWNLTKITKKINVQELLTSRKLVWLPLLLPRCLCRENWRWFSYDMEKLGGKNLWLKVKNTKKLPQIIILKSMKTLRLFYDSLHVKIIS